MPVSEDLQVEGQPNVVKLNASAIANWAFWGLCWRQSVS